MLSPSLVAEIRRLLDAGVLSQRKIARQAGISRGIVQAIAQGKRRDPPPAEAPVEGAAEGPVVRCSGCGGMVHVPCRLCAARQWIATSRKARRPDRNEPLGLALTPEHQRRYEEVRKRREAAA